MRIYSEIPLPRNRKGRGEMKIKELIKALSQYPEDAVVLHEDSRNGINPIKLTPFVNIDGNVTNVYIGNIKIKR